jgi:hypothetical protein
MLIAGTIDVVAANFISSPPFYWLTGLKTQLAAQAVQRPFVHLLLVSGSMPMSSRQREPKKSGLPRVRTGPEPSYLERLGMLYAHPIRIKIHNELSRREMSPTEWLGEFGGGSYGRVLWHFRKLEEHGWLRKVRSQKAVAGRGRNRDLYRATELAVIDDETWKELPPSIQVAFTARGLRILGERMGGALARGAVDARESAHLFTCQTIEVDDAGWEAAMICLRDCFTSLAQEQLDAKVRLENSSAPGTLMTVALAGFESPRLRSGQPRSARAKADSSAASHPLQLGDEDLPLSTRIAKVFADPLNLRIVDLLHSDAMSPSQILAAAGGLSLQSVDRKCQTLAELGWIVRLEGGGPPIFYKAAGPEAFDADLWDGIPEQATGGEAWPVFASFCQKAEDALRQGSFNARQDRHLTFSTFLLDPRGWTQVTQALHRCHDGIHKVKKDARTRGARGTSPPQHSATFLIAGFEDPEG